jgi:ring-1,2-phenylacetyl-CoA epoxidase subunit PaaE
MHDFQPLTIAEVKPETADAISVTFAIPDDLREAYRYQPGQHLTLRATLDGEEQRRTYSICSGPADRHLRIAIKRVAGGRFSNWANDTLQAGSTVEVMPASGRFILPPGDGHHRHLVALAAGAGITPIMAMVKHALAQEPGTSFTLIYGNRNPGTILFREELEDLKDRHLQRFTLLHVLSHNDEGSAPLFEGRITADKVRALSETLIKPGEVEHVFLCGPNSMIKDARNALLALGFARERVHHEFFAPAGGARTGSDPSRPTSPKSSTGSREGSDPVVGTEAIAVLDGMRHRFIVPPGGHVVDAALAAGIRVPYSCKGGMCCTCRAKLVEGQAEMTTNYSLEPWEIERGFILTCQAVPKSERLVVDYDQM